MKTELTRPPSEPLAPLCEDGHPVHPDPDAVSLSQVIFGAVFPLAMFNTSYPDAYSDMMRMCGILQRRVSPERIEFMSDALFAVFQEEHKKTIAPQE